ncbi:PH domain-containing protein [soil metagenome]
MSILSTLLGNASQADTEKIAAELAGILTTGESVDAAFKFVRDMIVFTNKRMITVDVEGMTGKKREWTSVPYKAINRFSAETAGWFDVDAELRVWVIGQADPVTFELKGGTKMQDLYRILSEHVLRSGA